MCAFRIHVEHIHVERIRGVHIRGVRIHEVRIREECIHAGTQKMGTGAHIRSRKCAMFLQ